MIYCTPVYTCNHVKPVQVFQKPVPNLPTSLLDENVNLSLIEKFCVGNSFKKIKEMIQLKKENPTWKCRTCKKALRRSRSIICEHCLLRSHFTCSKLKEKPVGNWFCLKCREMFREGNSLDQIFKISVEVALSALDSL